MSEVWFYHLQRVSLEAALPGLIERTLQRSWRALVRTTSQERVEFLNGHLWTFSQNSFIPHGSKSDGNAERQPVYLTADQENPNGADVLFLVDGAEESAPEDFARCVLLFDGKNEERVAQARSYWSNLKDTGIAITYWQQQEDGKWVQTA